MPLRRVTQGECLASMAHDSGFADYKTIYDHPENARLKELRPNPNILSPGDPVYIPNKRDENQSRSTGRRHTFAKAGSGVWVRLVVKFGDDQPIANEPYVLVVGGNTIRGMTDYLGGIDHEVYAEARRGMLVFPSLRLGMHLRIGFLDPVDQLTGVRARLNNLGFSCGEADGDLDDRTEAAIRAFQRHAGLEPTGELDATTRGRLVSLHGC